MFFDPWRLGYTMNDTGRLSVHYPRRAVDGSLAYGAGFMFDPEPELTRSPDSERSILWRDVMGAGHV